MVLGRGRLRRAQPDRELLVAHPGRWLHKDFSSAARSLRWRCHRPEWREEGRFLCDRGENQGQSSWGPFLVHLSGQNTRFQDGCLFQVLAPPTPTPRMEQKAQRTVKKGKALPRRSVLHPQLCPLASSGLVHRGSGWKQPQGWPEARSPVTTT